MNYFELDRTLCRVVPDEVTDEDVIKVLREHGPMTMDKLRAKLGNVRCEDTIWGMINSSIRVRLDLRLEVIP